MPLTVNLARQKILSAGRVGCGAAEAVVVSSGARIYDPPACCQRGSTNTSVRRAMRTLVQSIAVVPLLLQTMQSVAASSTEMIQSMDSELPVVAAETTADSSSDDGAFRLGQVVEITEGAFVGFTGVVKEIDSDTGIVKLEVDVFGRPTPVEVRTSQLKR